MTVDIHIQISAQNRSVLAADGAPTGGWWLEAARTSSLTVFLQIYSVPYDEHVTNVYRISAGKLRAEREIRNALSYDTWR